jgi:hypothetical protein
MGERERERKKKKKGGKKSCEIAQESWNSSCGMQPPLVAMPSTITL